MKFFIRRQPADWIIIGLGNPGTHYAETRHNIGYWPVEKLLAEHDAQLKPTKNGMAARVRMADQNVLLLRSNTYMNESGLAVGPLAEKYEVAAERVIVLHDEMDLPAGRVRIKSKGGEGGHNGLRSITQELGTQEYQRVRIGIGRPPQGTPVIDYVLSDFEDKDWIDEAVATAADAARLIVASGPDIARNDIHTRC